MSKPAQHINFTDTIDMDAFKDLSGNFGDGIGKNDDIDFEDAANIFPNPCSNTFNTSTVAEDFENLSSSQLNKAESMFDSQSIK